MGQLESKYKSDTCRELRDCGAMVHVVPGTSDSSGWPDRNIIHLKWSGYIEFKGPRTALQGNQRLTLKEMTLRKHMAIILRESAKEPGTGIISVVTGKGLVLDTGVTVGSGLLLLNTLMDWTLRGYWEQYWTSDKGEK